MPPAPQRPERPQRMRKKLRYRLHWASGDAPNPFLKWTVWDWRFICPVFYTEYRKTGREVCNLLNARNKE